MVDSSYIALGSLVISATAIVVTYLGARQQLRANLEAEDQQWRRDRRADIYRRLIHAVEEQDQQALLGLRDDVLLFASDEIWFGYGVLAGWVSARADQVEAERHRVVAQIRREMAGSRVAEQRVGRWRRRAIDQETYLREARRQEDAADDDESRRG